MSTDSGWGDYLSADTPVVDTTATVTSNDLDTVAVTAAAPDLPEPAASIVESELTGAVNDQDWSNWHAQSGDGWVDSAQDWADYAVENAAAGHTDIAESAMALAADHAAIAENNYAVADDRSTAVTDHLANAAAEIAPYTTGATETYPAGTEAIQNSGTSYDTAYSYDAGTGFDTAASTFDTGTTFDVAE